MKPNQVHPLLADLPQETSLCFTGHRPEKLPRGAVYAGMKQTLEYYIRYAVTHGYTCFYTGMADGIDYLASDYLFRVREARPHIRVIGIQPCQDYDDFFRRRGYDLSHLEEMRRNADRVIVLPGSYSDSGIFLKRNRVMVDHCKGIIAVCNDGRSGSMSALSYAKSRGLSYCRIYTTPQSGILPPPQSWRIEQQGFLT